MRRLPHRRAVAHVSRDRWLVSYADFMTLLFAFFATMYAISSVDAQKLSRVATALQVAFDDQRPQRAAAASVSSSAAPLPEVTSADVETVLARELSDELADGRLELIVDHRGVTLSIPEAGVFATGSDELSDAAQAMVTRVAAVLNRFSNLIRVEGHTDDVPIHTVRFQSNWDLSAARASRVVEYLIARGIDPTRVSATGYGEFHPRVPNRTDSLRARNRRIDLVIQNANNAAEAPPTGGRTP